MNIKVILSTLFLGIALSGAVHAQVKTLLFEDELCSYKGFYDSKKYTERQLKDTYTLVTSYGYVGDEGTLAEMTARYTAEIDRLKKLQIANSSYFKNLQQDVLNYVQQTFALKKVQKQAKQNPQALTTAVKKGGAAYTYGIALQNGGTELLESYKALTLQQMKNNAAPDHLWDQYTTTIARADKLEKAFAYVLVYGWWNSANREVHHIEYDGTQSEQYRKLFTKIETIDCDEP
ncbi:hypothetical protein E2P86_09865 [Sphingobacterium psychroaquaticum]|uniref:hypothetical protein n=1 Tax=Sphingobacterium psychroaquaticum TaxID=561061 RepID=UPI00106B5F09|nr:hypothetical protein [Sphingobacterium psychroaquaticum]QBQ41444.1 hypothetical protein E2P86_09865 [Sphingobacterium psychroaquaticum]